MFTQPASSKPIISPRTIAEISEVWKQYEILKSQQTTPPTKNIEAANAAIAEVFALLSNSKEYGRILNAHEIHSEDIRITADGGLLIQLTS